MDRLVANNSTEGQQESYRLLSILSNLEHDLEQPYIERRLKSISHKSTPLEELQDAIQELTQREKDLQACIGISKVLIENNESLLQKNQGLYITLQDQKNENYILKEEIDRLKDEFELLEVKYQEANSLLVKTESKYLKLVAKSKKSIESSPNLKQIEPDYDENIDKYETDIAELTEKYKIEQEHFLRQKIDLEKKNKIFEEKLQESTKTVQDLEKQSDESLKKIRVLERNLKKSEQELTEQTKIREETEQLYDALYEKHKFLLALTEKQAEEIEIIQLASPKSASIPSHKESSSLHLELQDLEDLEVEDFENFSNDKAQIFTLNPEPVDRSGKKNFTFPVSELRKSFRMAPRTLGIYKQFTILVPCIKSNRKPPSEEYFYLSTQAIKLNSMYLDSICTISPNTLYQTALKNDIPFHKWHIWIEKQLNAAYLTSIYKRDSRSFN